MQTQKKSWKKPVLIIIGRGNPEESVLKQCKGGGVPDAGGPSGQVANLMQVINPVYLQVKVRM